MKILLKQQAVNRITISLSATEEELWETEVKLLPSFGHIEEGKDKGVKVAFDQDGQTLSVHVPAATQRKMPVNEDNMTEKDNIKGTPDGEVAIIEQNPSNTDIMVDQTGGTPSIVDAPTHSTPSYSRSKSSPRSRFKQ